VAISVVIPTHNGGSRVVRLLARLARERAASGAEVIVVDNASTDDDARHLGDGAARDALRAAGWTLRVSSESTRGSGFARLRGLDEARNDLVCFLDDDVEPAPGFMAGGLAAFADPRVGGVVPQVLPAYELTPPPSILKRQHLLAVNHHCLPASRVEWTGAAYPFAPVITAAFFARREALRSALGARGRDRLLPGRVGNQLACGEDTEWGILLQRAGFAVAYEPSLAVHHLIPASRLQPRYFAKLIAGIVRSEETLRAIYAPRVHAPGKPKLALALLAALAATPLLLVRRDGVREARFVLASRIARLRGPFPELLVTRGV
jgi:GT2 family glycosyltransferase